MASSALLTHNCVCWGLVANGCLPVIWEQDPGFLGYSERLYHDAMISKWPDPTQDCRWVGQPCKLYAPNQSSRCKCCHNSLLRIFASGSTTYRTTLEILARQQSLCHAKLGVSHPLAARQSPGSKALNTDRWLSFSLRYFRFHTSVSVLWFSHFSIFHLPCPFHPSEMAVGALENSCPWVVCFVMGVESFVQVQNQHNLGAERKSGQWTLYVSSETNLFISIGYLFQPQGLICSTKVDLKFHACRFWEWC